MSSLVMRVALPTPPSRSCGLLRTFAYAHSGGKDLIGPGKVVFLEAHKVCHVSVAAGCATHR